ncbi:helix-turn-helix transcriptional regulator [uncultured Anaerococcus sp.]|uniref:helix-turn-helix domain-containing protein n=1 Tax=uncultured Anaerococcus sp. TaxID=293428 RepID=UPI0025D3D339|nr:helix-turn-helix transcriptional regulator [uncultured Anaerococcus sp.]
MIDERKEFGKKLIEIREVKGLRQADVADIADISQRTIGRLERGEIESASVDSLIELSKIYGLDVLTLYKKYIYGDYCILEEIKNSLDINAMFLTKDIRIDLLEKINLIKDSRELRAIKYEINLLELFIRYLNSEITNEELSEIYEDLSSTKIKRKNFDNLDLQGIDLRILLNIASTSQDFKGIDRVEIFNKCKNQDKDKIVKIGTCNNLANWNIINKNYEEAIKIANEGIEYARINSSIDALLYLYFSRFIACYRANKNYEESLTATKVLLVNILNKDLQLLMNKKIEIILG